MQFPKNSTNLSTKPSLYGFKISITTNFSKVTYITKDVIDMDQIVFKDSTITNKDHCKEYSSIVDAVSCCNTTIW